MNLSCYVVDDEFHSVEIIKSYVGQTPGLELRGFSTDPRVALKEVGVPGSADVTFIDVDMPELSGMELAGLLSPYTRVVFTTSYPEFAVEAFEKEAVDYLLKPVSYERFLKAVMRIRREREENLTAVNLEDDFFYIKTDVKGKISRVAIADIYFVESADHYIKIHFSSGMKMAYLTMEEVRSRLPEKYFIQVHRCFIVNNRRIQTFEHGQLTLSNQDIVPVGRAFRPGLLEEMNGALFKSKRS